MILRFEPVTDEVIPSLAPTQTRSSLTSRARLKQGAPQRPERRDKQQADSCRGGAVLLVQRRHRCHVPDGSERKEAAADA